MESSPSSPLERSLPAVAARPPAEPGSSARDVAAQFEGLLVREILTPLSKSLGFYGDAVVREAARTIALGERGGLMDTLERAIAERAP